MLKATAPLAALASRAKASPHTPWIFYPDGWDWRWHSWARVADQVTRGAALLRDAALVRNRWQGEAPRIGFDAGQHPDAIAAGLAIQAAGAVAVPIAGSDADVLEQALASGCVAWATNEEARLPEPPTGLARCDLPAALSPLERTVPQPLELDAGATSGAIGFPGGGQLSQTDLTTASVQLDKLLQLRVGRPIACVEPRLEPRLSQLLQAWLLASGAAWVLENEPDAFLPTVLWARPTLVVATAAEIASLATRLKVRKHRRHHRLEAIGLVGDERPDPTLWDELGVPIVDLSADTSPYGNPPPAPPFSKGES